MSDQAITPFTLSISNDAIADLKTRLGSTRWPEQLPGPAWQRGVPVDYLRPVADYWAANFDWRVQEKRINAYPQFTTEVDGQRIHFLHVRSAVEGATPLLLLHGWPGSFVEFLDVIDSLIDPVAHGGTPCRCLPRRRTVAAGFRLVGAVGRRRMGEPEDGRSPG